LENIVKQNFLAHHPLTYIGIVLFILFAVLVNIPGSFTFVVAFFTIILSLFIYDNRNHVSLFTLSLPISKRDFIAGRYIFSVATIITILIIMWVAMNLLFLTQLDSDGRYLYHWKDMIILFTIGSLMLSIVLPIHYLLPFNIAASILAIGFLLGTYYYISMMVNSLERNDADLIMLNDLDAGLIIFVEESLPFLPYIILTIGAIIALYLSMTLSTFIVKRKDV